MNIERNNPDEANFEVDYTEKDSYIVRCIHPQPAGLRFPCAFLKKKYVESTLRAYHKKAYNAHVSVTISITNSARNQFNKTEASQLENIPKEPF